MEYHREFYPVAFWLVSYDEISTRERDRYFWEGLPLSKYRAIHSWMKI